jgi:hypothetical protein
MPAWPTIFVNNYAYRAKSYRHLTPLRSFSLEEGEVLLRHDLVNEDAEEQADACTDLDS